MFIMYFNMIFFKEVITCKKKKEQSRANMTFKKITEIKKAANGMFCNRLVICPFGMNHADFNIA